MLETDAASGKVFKCCVLFAVELQPPYVQAERNQIIKKDAAPSVVTVLKKSRKNVQQIAISGSKKNEEQSHISCSQLSRAD